MSDTVNYKLKKPITVGNQTYESFNFRECTAGDMVAGDKFDGNFARTLAVLACMADVKLDVMKAVKASDLGPMTAAVAHLLGESNTAVGSI